ncbi:MAG: DTW domain-containing protein [Pseudomonadota bacterium]
MSDVLLAATVTPATFPNAVSLLRAALTERRMSTFKGRGGRHRERCAGCRLVPSHCLCAWRPVQPSRAGFCLIMTEKEVHKPTNTGWLVADLIADTMAFSWTRMAVDPALPALLADPQWQPYVVFPGEFVAPERVLTQLLPANRNENVEQPGAVQNGQNKRPLFILLDATWQEARRMFKQSAYLMHIPVLSFTPEQLSRYRLRDSGRGDHLCTAEVAALCLELADDNLAAQTLTAYLDLFSDHYMRAKLQQKVDWESELHLRLRELALLA